MLASGVPVALVASCASQLARPEATRPQTSTWPWPNGADAVCRLIEDAAVAWWATVVLFARGEALARVIGATAHVATNVNSANTATQ